MIPRLGMNDASGPGLAIVSSVPSSASQQYQVPQSGRLRSYDCHMSTPILDTKLRALPPRPNAVPRPSLIERLDDGLQSRLILVSAPAGFGKTTMVSEWVAGCNRREPDVRPAWLSLDEGDSDSALFLAYLVAALRTVAADVGQGVLGMLQSPQPPPTETMLTALLNEITTLPYGLVLVLDDYHLVDSEPVDQALTFLLEHLPPQMHLVIVTREDPRLPLARWRARGQLTELRAADLRFTPSEAAEFLNRVMGLDLSAEDVTALESRTEGWIAGLQLAALSIQGRSDAASFIQTFSGSHRFVLDYLVEEVLQRQPQRVRSFLLQTAILDKLCGALCDAVTGQKHGKAMLELLERGNLFVVPLDEERQWYRYHHLFADVLHVHLLDQQPDQLPALQRRASEWYEENGSRSDAIRHALCSEDFGWAAELIERAGLMTEDGSQAATWLKWTRALPDEMIRSRPVLSAWYACALLGSGELEAAEARLKDAERRLEPGRGAQAVVADEEQLRSLLATIAVVRAYNAQAVGDVPGTLKHAQRVFELLPEGDHFRREQATGLVGMTYWASGDLQAADRVFAGYSTRMLAAGNIPDAMGTASVLADIRPPLGRLRAAVDTFTELLQVGVDRGGPLPPEAADLYRGLGELDLERGDLAAAARHLQTSEELGEQGERPTWRWRWCVARARLDQAEGDLEGALSLLDEAQRLFIRTPLPEVRPVPALKARIWAMQGRVAEASEWARERGLSVDDDLSYLREFEHVTLARVLIAQYESERVDGAVHDAARLLERLLHAAEQGGRTGSVIEILAVQALAHQARGDTTLALAPLEHALSLAEPEGYVRVFVDEGAPMAGLLQEAVFRAIAPDSARRVLAAFPSVRPDGARPSEAQCEDRQLLSEREIEVLQHIAAGLTNREIAARLYLSLYTVKAHARSIYDKLDAHSRTQAVARARDLGILPRF
jgi:LuxR family maltose regulon positive regulatory protein